MKRKTSVAITIIVVVIAAAALFAYFRYGSGTLEIKITNPPSDWGEATQVYLNYSAIEIHQEEADNESGWFPIVEKSSWINLTRTLDVNRTVGYANLQAGRYNLVHFRVLDARVTVDDKNYTASVQPSDKITIEIPKGIQVNTGQTATIVIETKVKVGGSGVDDYSVQLQEVKALPA